MWLFTKAAAIAVTRTGVAYLYALLLGKIPFINDFLVGNDLSETIEGFVNGGFVLVVGTLLYTAIRELAQRFPIVGRLLIFTNEPEYSE